MDRIPLEVSQPQKDFVFAHFQSNFKTIDANDGVMKALGNATETRHLQVFPLLHISWWRADWVITISTNIWIISSRWRVELSLHMAAIPAPTSYQYFLPLISSRLWVKLFKFLIRFCYQFVPRSINGNARAPTSRMCHTFVPSPSGALSLVLNFSSLFFIESSWTSSPPRPPSPSQSQTSFDTLSRKQNF